MTEVASANVLPSWCRSPHLTDLQISCEAYREVVQKDPRFLKFFQQGTPVNELGRMNIGSRLAPGVRRSRVASSLVVCQAVNLQYAYLQSVSLFGSQQSPLSSAAPHLS